MTVYFFSTLSSPPHPAPNPDRGEGRHPNLLSVSMKLRPSWLWLHGTVSCDPMGWMLQELPSPTPTREARFCCIFPTPPPRPKKTVVAQRIGRCSVSCRSGRCVSPVAVPCVSLVGCLGIRPPSFAWAVTRRERPGGRSLLSCRCRSARPIILSMCDRRHLDREEEWRTVRFFFFGF